MDINDEDIDIKKFMLENTDIENFFKDVISNIFLNLEPYEHMKVCAEYLGYTYSAFSENSFDDFGIYGLEYGSIPYDDTYIFGSLYLVDKKIDISEIQNVFKEKYDIYDISEYTGNYTIEQGLDYDKSTKYIILMYEK